MLTETTEHYSYPNIIVKDSIIIFYSFIVIKTGYTKLYINLFWLTTVKLNL